MLKLFYFLFVFILFIFLAISLFSLVNAGAQESQNDSSLDKKQAVCNVTPNDKGDYDEEGCKKAFQKLPEGTICSLNETATINSCTVNANSCTSSSGTQGRWCTCTYTCTSKSLF
jgi:hypothetical protein